MKKLDLSRPDILFFLIWFISTGLAFLDIYEMGIVNSFKVSSLIGFNIISFFLAYYLMNRLMNKNTKLGDSSIINVNLGDLTKITYQLSAFWFVLYLFIIYKSNGLPIFWSILHVNKSYVDYGVSTLSGFANSIRVFIFCLGIYIYLQNKNKKMLLMALMMFVFSLTELARGNTVYLVLCGVSVFCMHVKFNLLSRKLFGFILISFITFIGFFGFVEKIRTPEVTEEDKKVRYYPVIKNLPTIKSVLNNEASSFNSEASLYGVNKVYVSGAEMQQQNIIDRFDLNANVNSFFRRWYMVPVISNLSATEIKKIQDYVQKLQDLTAGKPTNVIVEVLKDEEVISLRSRILQRLPYGFKAMYNYIATPVANLYYAESQGINPLNYPYFSIQVIVPSVIRTRMFENQQYPIKLRSKAFNATSFYSPFIADFGFAVTGIIVFLIQLAVSFVHIRASKGLWNYQLIYAPLFTSIALSFFYTYIISPSVLIFSFFTYLVGLRLRKMKRQADKT